MIRHKTEGHKAKKTENEVRGWEIKKADKLEDM